MDPAQTRHEISVSDTVLAAAVENLRANAEPGGVLSSLRAIETAFQNDPPRRARLLIARGTALNRLGFAGEALADLQEAVRLLERAGSADALVEAWQQIALVYTWSGNTGQAAIALLHAIAEAGGSFASTALALIQGGRILGEIGRPQEAQALLKRAIEIGEGELAPIERERAAVSLVQALVACGRIEEADKRLQALDLSQATPRLRRLAELERARIALACGDIKRAHAVLDEVKQSLADMEDDSFDRIEYRHVLAEVALAERDDETALALLPPVIARYADDDLVGREIEARLLEMRALERLGWTEECDRTVAAGLRRASARGLSGYVDKLRGELAKRGRPESIWLPGLAPMPASGRDAAQRFVRRRTLGAGGFGTVSRAYDLDLGMEVALKRVSLRTLFDPKIRASLYDSARAEAAAASRIAHPGIGKVYGLLDEPDGDLLVVREFIEGQTLREAMATSLSLPQKQTILSRIALSLAALHEAGLVHRDVKPENVILRDDADPVLIDLGIARDLAAVDRSVAGTPGYAAPEQLHGKRTDARADLYAFGVVAYELLTGRRPAEAEAGIARWIGFDLGRRRIASDVHAVGLPQQAAELIAGLLSLSPRRRPRSARAVALEIAPG
jgi:hypothetical protein